MNNLVKTRIFLQRPNKGVYLAYVGERLTDLDLYLVQKNNLKQKYTFSYC